MKTKQDINAPDKPRREAILGGLAVVASLLFAFNPFKSSAKKPDQVRMLSPDGKLVEIDASVLAAKKKTKITDKELQKWVKDK